MTRDFRIHSNFYTISENIYSAYLTLRGVCYQDHIIKFDFLILLRICSTQLILTYLNLNLFYLILSKFIRLYDVCIIKLILSYLNLSYLIRIYLTLIRFYLM